MSDFRVIGNYSNHPNVEDGQVIRDDYAPLRVAVAVERHRDDEDEQTIYIYDDNDDENNISGSYGDMKELQERLNDFLAAFENECVIRGVEL